MPTSTIWRRSAGNSYYRGISPVRPSDDAIERISPEPSFPPTFPDTASLGSFAQPWQDSTQGLGLSHTALLDNTHTSRPPEELYIDRNGDGALVRGRAGDVRSRPQHYHSPPQDRSSRQSKQNRSHRSSKSKGHTRSGSTIDDLASAAIATSPTFANGPHYSYFVSGSPNAYSPTRPSTSHLTYFSYPEHSYEPPAKRVKSERLPAAEWNPQPVRPTTSYHQNSTLSEDAELLLSLRTEVNFTKQTSPPAKPVQLDESPTQFQPAFSPPLPPTTAKDEPPNRNNVDVDVDIPPHHMAPVADEPEPVTNGFSEKEHTPSGKESDNPLADNIAPDVPVPEAAMDSPETGPGPAPEPAAIEVKKTRRIKPQVQAEVCAECNKLQRETEDEDAGITWISCNGCNRWFHAGCVGFKGKSEARSVDKFVCKQCQPEHGQTTFVRTSSRARTAIDYAGLNQGFVKSSIETSMHHYIQPIKSGKFAIQRDDFARVRPELLTVEFMENFDNMKRPFVVPACWNRRFGSTTEAEAQAEAQSEKDQPIEQRYDSAGSPMELEATSPIYADAEPVIDCDQDLLDMVMPRDLTVRKVAELYGKHELVPVIDVKTQETKGAWTLEQWADYYELPGEKPIRNVISLEVSDSRIGRLIRRPKVVRELDLEDEVWDAEARTNQKKRPVQYYCLMSVADSYTDFHIDFGGSSVYYHILKGTKTFFFIPPEDRYLKKYEEWCNSQDQNDTWLPDLCNGCVTRVDLHEGDTAFIPAGWIHSVWTPEDSLVIGGNFLTRIDYELQLKVANVEKVTKVAPKFRYPFFQKVMWYALLKYLVEDPVPEEVLQDFQGDPEYVFLRANPVWHELDDLANIAEPGSAEYNTRYYPKSEIKGLPPLRDYLYRTARIYADLPVPDINKKQIEAVKNSIPKGHGDPLVLIKTFAVWSAWKTGNVTTPEWVHSDEGVFPELEKKVKKAENVKLPGERSSLRRAAHNSPRELTGPAVITPYKPGFNAAGLHSDPAKKGRPASHKPSGVRTACDPCRKRRVRCPHKEGTTSPSAADSATFSRSQSPAVTPATNGATIDRATPIAPMPDGLSSLDADHGAVPVPSNLAQAALASIDPSYPNEMMVDGLTSSGKKSRSKACEECRKSKRRCVHDEYGRVDAAKAAEPSKPRGSSNTKRPSRPSDENLHAKRIRLDDEQGGEVGVDPDNLEAMLDPALFEQAIIPSDDAMQLDLPNSVFDAPTSAGLEEQSIEVATSKPEGDATAGRPSQVLDLAETVSPTTVKREPDAAPAMVQQQGATTESESTIAAQETTHGVVLKPASQSQTPGASTSPMQRHSSRQPKLVERYVPDAQVSPTKPLPQPRGERRGSSAASGPTVVNSVKSRRSSSNTSDTTHQIAATMEQASSPGAVRPVSRASTAESDLNPDEKLARELQAQEHGLRRRQSMRL